MAQGWFERVGLYLARKVIPSRTKIARDENRARRNFLLQVEVVLQCVWELWMVSPLKNENRFRQESIPRVEKIRKHIGIYVVERRQNPIATKENKGELIAKHTDPAPQHSFAVAEDVPCKA